MQRFHPRFFIPLLLLTLVSGHGWGQDGSGQKKIAKIAIIIDDLGYSLTYGMQAVQYPGPLTLAVLPFGPNSQKLAKTGYERGKEIMLHAPMSTLAPQPLDKGALTSDMDHTTFIQTLRDSIHAIPYISGINNHMGSALTQNQQSMNWLMGEVSQHGLFFIDSRTSASSVAQQTAENHMIPSRTRDIFLDHERTPEAVAHQFQRLIHLAHKKGSAIAIGHPTKVTMDFLNSQANRFDQLGVQLVSVSELLPQMNTSLSHLDDEPGNRLPIPEDSLTPEQIVY
ncbi:MAG: divergent polysaccharide deacetylase family protein [Candidatus Pelagadaptatus aseana]|uniref:divergent polysaccharide deacetylase family protein n=1 Tax=Candidatus Pelagadaptatus aseana TaxID=3120508 RepID=UPI0039B195F9